MKLGLITIGQSPRTDFTDDVADLLPGDVEILQRGALDAVSPEQLAAMAPGPDDAVLVSRMRDGSQAVFAERHILPRLQTAVDELEAKGCGTVLLLCTGRFPDFRHTSLLVKPQEFLLPLINRLGESGKLGVIIPEEEQRLQFRSWWKLPDEKIHMVCASPYGEREQLIGAAEELKRLGVSMIYMDCMGYSRGMKRLVGGISDCPVFLPRTLIVRILGEVLE